jgi:hypothetical protein
VNWYKLDAVRAVLRLDYAAELAPGVVRPNQPHLEVWRRTVGEEVFTTFLNYESDEFLVPEEQLLSAAESLSIKPVRAFMERVKARGGLWLGPNPGA